MTRLRHSDPAAVGITRRRCGTGFSYRGPDAKLVGPADRQRIVTLAIPPAWSDVWISPHPNGHIQATGIDAAGRRQYLYHRIWREQKDRLKFDRALELAASLSGARRQVTLDLRGNGCTHTRVLAGAFRMLDRGSLRVGSEQYADENGSHGLATLLCRHVVVAGATIRLEFPAKAGLEWSSTIDDPDLARLLRALKRRGRDERLLAWQHDEGGWRVISAEEINATVRKLTGGDFTAKDFRTLHGTLAAAVCLAKLGAQPSKTAQARAITAATVAASEVLGNTPAIARRSYIDPRVLDRFRHGATIDHRGAASTESQLLELLAQSH